MKCVCRSIPCVDSNLKSVTNSGTHEHLLCTSEYEEDHRVRNLGELIFAYIQESKQYEELYLKGAFSPSVSIRIFS